MNPSVHFYELNGIPYGQVIDCRERVCVLNCSVEPPEKMGDFKCLPKWTPISATIFNRLRDAYVAAAENQGCLDLEVMAKKQYLQSLFRKN